MDHTRARAQLAASALAATATTAVLLASPAMASVPKGQYECFDLGYNFTLKSNDKYKIQTGGGGKWTSKGKKVKFKTGPLNFAYGKLRTDTNGNPVIDLYDVGDGTFYDNCPKI